MRKMTEAVTVRLPPDITRRVEELADKELITRSAVIRRWVLKELQTTAAHNEKNA